MGRHRPSRTQEHGAFHPQPDWTHSGHPLLLSLQGGQRQRNRPHQALRRNFRKLPAENQSHGHIVPSHRLASRLEHRFGQRTDLRSAHHHGRLQQRRHGKHLRQRVPSNLPLPHFKGRSKHSVEPSPHRHHLRDAPHRSHRHHHRRSGELHVRGREHHRNQRNHGYGEESGDRDHHGQRTRHRRHERDRPRDKNRDHSKNPVDDRNGRPDPLHRRRKPDADLRRDRFRQRRRRVHRLHHIGHTQHDGCRRLQRRGNFPHYGDRIIRQILHHIYRRLLAGKRQNPADDHLEPIPVGPHDQPVRRSHRYRLFRLARALLHSRSFGGQTGDYARSFSRCLVETGRDSGRHRNRLRRQRTFRNSGKRRNLDIWQVRQRTHPRRNRRPRPLCRLQGYHGL